MPRVFRVPFGRRGERKLSKYYYMRLNGKKVSLKVTDRRVAEQKAAELERIASIGYDPDGIERARKRPIADHLQAFEDSLLNRNCCQEHIATCMHRLRRMVRDCGIETLADVDVPMVEAYLARRQRDPADRFSAQSRKHYARNALALGGFLLKSGRVSRNPFAGLTTDMNVEADRKRIRRALTADECQRLLSAKYDRRWLGGLSPEDRRVTYLIMITTGLRRGEVSSLTPESFDLNGDQPTIRVEGKWTKNKRVAVLPLRQDVAAQIRDWLDGKEAGVELLPLRKGKKTAMIRADLRAAQIAYETPQGIVDLHSLRTTFATNLARGGVSLSLAQKLCRHSTPHLTAVVYQRLNLDDLQKAVESLPPTSGRDNGRHSETDKR